MNIREKDISVIVPVFNGEKTIINTLQSICQQTAKEYIKQIIIIDDGSTDMTAQIIAEYSKQVDIKSEKSGNKTSRGKLDCAL